MLISPGGMERTADEFGTLLTNSGFRLTRIVPTMSPVGIVEAVKAELKMPDLKVRQIPVVSQTRIPLVANGTVDLECGSTTNTLTRHKQADFSHVTFIGGTRLLVKAKAGHRGGREAAGGRRREQE